MRKAIVVTRPDQDGVYTNVGMTHRRIYRLKTVRGVLNRIKRNNFASTGERLRFEFFHDTYDEYPNARQIHKAL